MTVTKARKARKAHRCDTCRRPIEPGSVYVTHTALAGDEYYHDVLRRDTLEPLNQPIRFKECGDCASSYGRKDLVEARAAS